MRIWCVKAVILVGIVVAANGCCDPARCPYKAQSGDECSSNEFVTIFDGQSLDGWEIYIQPGATWHEDAFYLEDGTLACKGYGFHWFRYKEPLGDCIVKLEFKIAEDSNSGVVLRSAKTGEPPLTGFEIQIIDDVGKDPHKHGTGAVYHVTTPMYNALKPVGEWNEMTIRTEDLCVVVHLNGRKVIDTDFSNLTEPIGKFPLAYADLPAEGYLALQDHWTPIWYRNIQVKKLD